jgi:SHS2 domain-containing protein
VRETRTALEHGDRWTLRAEARGESRDPARHGIKVLVKAVTYHGLEIVRTERGYEATVVFDI